MSLRVSTYLIPSVLLLLLHVSAAGAFCIRAELATGGVRLFDSEITSPADSGTKFGLALQRTTVVNSAAYGALTVNAGAINPFTAAWTDPDDQGIDEYWCRFLPNFTGSGFLHRIGTAPIGTTRIQLTSCDIVASC